MPARPPTPIVGRDEELAQIVALLARTETQLVTLTGPGGVGKTRLALAVAHHLGLHALDIRWCDLAALTTAGQALAAIGQRYGIGNVSQLGPLLRAFAPQPTLLILDNAEHLPDLAAPLAALLAEVPQLRLLVTSRAPLSLRAEQVFPVAPLPVPDPNAAATPDALLTLPSVALLVARAHATQPAFQLSPANAPAVAELCARLDGLPLALELAAARLTTLSPAGVLARLGPSSVSALALDAPDRPARHQTLRHTVTWSVTLLSPAAQHLFAALSVFADGWTLPAAEAVCAAPPLPVSAVLDALDALVRHSLVQRRDLPSGEPRYTMLATIHAVAAERLGDDDHGLRARHAASFLTLAEAADTARFGPDQQGWLAALAAEQANLEQALEHYRATSQIAAALRLAGALGWFWIALDLLPAGRTWLATLLADPAASDAPAAPRARALQMLGTIARHQGDYDAAHAAYSASHALWEAEGALGPASDVACGLAEVAYRRNNLAVAAEEFTRAHRASQQAADERRVAAALGGLARVRWAARDDRTARHMQRDALARHEALGDAYGATWSRCALGEIARGERRYDRAAEELSVAVAGFAALGQRGPRALALQNLGFVHLALGACDQAAAIFSETLATWRCAGARHGIALSLVGLAGVALATGDATRAAQLLGAAEPHLEAIGGHLERTDAADLARIGGGVAAALPVPQRTAARAIGRGGPVDSLLQPGGAAPPAPALTERERAVLHLVARGHTNRAIAAQLNLSPQTVAVHLRALFRKLDVHSRTAAVAAGRRARILLEELP